jgi:hypothetical protein
VQKNNFSLEFNREYKIKELIFVNSGSNYYMRLPVDSHAAIIADNNSGKTSTLSALKLFLLPEISFKKQSEKFGFSSGRKFFEDLDSYLYYFPGADSYIICNASNPKGDFCWVLYRTTDLRYERIALPVSYDEIEHLFWDGSAKNNENAGKLHSDIESKGIKKTLITTYGGKPFNDRKSIGDSIYTRTSNDNDDSQFCLLPMIKGYSSNKTETIRALLNMAFDLSNAATTSLPMAIASILDGQSMSAVKRNNSEGILVDLEAQLDEWRELKQINSKLNLVKDNNDLWKSLEKSRENFKHTKREFIEKYKNITCLVKSEKIKNDKEVQEVAKRVEEADKHHQSVKENHKTVKVNYDEAKMNAQSEMKSLESLKSTIDKVEETRRHLKPLNPNDDSDDAILLALNEQIELCQKDIESLKDKNKAIRRMEELIRRVKINKHKVERLTETIEHTENKSSLFDDLESGAGSKLLSLNKDFGKLTVRLSQEQKKITESFCELITVSEQRVYFCESELITTEFIETNSSDHIKKYKNEIEELNSWIHKDSIEIKKNKEYSLLTKEEQAKRLQECQDELKDLIKNRDDLKAFDSIMGSIEEGTTKLQRAEEKYKEENAKYEKAKRDEIESRLAREKEHTRSAKINQYKSDIRFRAQKLETIEHSTGHLFKFEQVLDENVHEELCVKDRAIILIDSKIEELEDLKGKLIREHDETISKTRELLDKGIVESDIEDRYQLKESDESLDNYYYSLESVFRNIDKSLESFKQRLEHHNNQNATVTKIIENVESWIKAFFKQLNEEMKKYKISNLSSVELIAELHPQYNEVIKTLNSTGNRTDILHTEDFYALIANFQDNFYIKRVGKIDISRIIEKVSYRFTRNGAVEDIPQSNGTNCMVNAVLLALLLNGMVPEDIGLNMPVVFDEVGSLDEKNFKEILKVMEEHGLFLFAANPEQNGIIASVLSVYHPISTFRVVDDEVIGKAEIIYYPGMEERLEEISHGI